jgi:aminomethyltransferase
METTTLHRTALHEAHLRAGAKMVPFAGYEMPVQYEGLHAEHQAVRTSCGMFDVSHMGEFTLEGPDAQALIQWVSSNDASKLTDGKVQYACMPNGQGGIVDDMLVYRMSATKYMLVVNASNRDKDWVWIQSQIYEHAFDVQLTDDSDRYALIALQGPHADAALEALNPVRKDNAPWATLTYYTFTEASLLGYDVLVSATGYTGAGGVEIYLPVAGAEAVWEALREAGVPPCGLGARDTLRMEMGFCLYGNDIDDSTSPLAAGLGWITKFTKDFVGRERFEAEKAAGSPAKLVGLVMAERGIPRQGYDVLDLEGRVVGRVTSGTMSPSLGHGIGMAYIEASLTPEGTPLLVQIRNKAVSCHVARFPFYKGGAAAS